MTPPTGLISILVDLISLDVTMKLVAVGVVSKAWNVLSATNTSPIIVGLDAPHKALVPLHGVVNNVGGNTAANGIWVLTPTDHTHFSLSLFDPQGNPIVSRGNGPFTAGGTVQIALSDGRINIGRKHASKHGAPPRIVFVPFGDQRFEFEPYAGGPNPGSLPSERADLTPEQQTMRLQRQIATEKQVFEVHTWGAANPRDPDRGDVDFTQALYRQVIQSVWDLCSGMDVLRGRFIGQDPKVNQLDKSGEYHVMIVSIDTPVTDTPLSFVSSSTTAEIVVNFTGGTSDDDVVIDFP